MSWWWGSEERISDQLSRMEWRLTDSMRTLKELLIMAQADIDAIKVEVGELKTVNGSILALVDRMAAAILENADDPTELRAIAEELRAERQAIAAKVTENTPQA